MYYKIADLFAETDSCKVAKHQRFEPSLSWANVSKYRDIQISKEDPNSV